MRIIGSGIPISHNKRPRPIALSIFTGNVTTGAAKSSMNSTQFHDRARKPRPFPDNGMQRDTRRHCVVAMSSMHRDGYDRINVARNSSLPTIRRGHERAIALTKASCRASAVYGFSTTDAAPSLAATSDPTCPVANTIGIPRATMARAAGSTVSRARLTSKTATSNSWLVPSSRACATVAAQPMTRQPRSPSISSSASNNIGSSSAASTRSPCNRSRTDASWSNLISHQPLLYIMVEYFNFIRPRYDNAPLLTSTRTLHRTCYRSSCSIGLSEFTGGAARRMTFVRR